MYEKPISRPGRDPLETLVDVLAAANRYDLLLAVVPVAFAVALVVATVLDVALRRTLLVAAAVGALAIVDACYRNPPIDQGSA